MGGYLTPNFSVGNLVSYYLTAVDAAGVNRIAGEQVPMLIENIDSSGNLYGRVIVDGNDGDDLHVVIKASEVGAMVGPVSTIESGNNGAGYAVANGLETSGGRGSGATINITAVNAGALSTVTLDNAGEGYERGDVLEVVQAGGSGGTVTVTAVTGSGQLAQFIQ